MDISQPIDHDHSSSIQANWLIVIQYFILGVCKALGDTMLLTYPVLPAYSVISIFTAAKLPFSFKFIIGNYSAYSSSFYRALCKRLVREAKDLDRSWLRMRRYATHSDGSTYRREAPDTPRNRLLRTTHICRSTKRRSDIAGHQANQRSRYSRLDARNREDARWSVRQFGFPQNGIAGFRQVLRKNGTNMQREHLLRCSGYSYFGSKRSQPFLAQVNRYTHIYSVLAGEVTMGSKSLWNVIMEYKVFTDSNSRYFRQALLFLIMNQGHHFFFGGLQYELIKNGFSKERINELDNIMVIPIMGLTCLASWFNSMPNIWRNIWIILILKLLVDIAIFVSMPKEIWSVAIVLFVCRLLTSCGVLLNTTVVASFPVTALSGVLVSGFQSAREFGNNSALHQRVIHEVGWEAASIYGFILHGAIICVFWSMVQWVQGGELKDADSVKETDQEGANIK